MVSAVDDPQRIAHAYRTCLALARAHYENFPVASWLVPADMRPHVAAVYAFARIADDYADEGAVEAAERRARLDAWRARAEAAAEGRDASDGPHPDVFIALAHSMRERRLPVTLFTDLVSAFAQDTQTTRYQTWADVRDYCRRSANPVGRLVLRIAGVHDARADAMSDAVCTALQLANFWQDLAVDWARGRLYIPLAVAARHDADVSTLDPGALTHAWQRALAECVSYTRDLFLEGRGVTDVVTGRLRHELRLTWLGGMRILERLDRQARATRHERPALGARDAIVIGARWMTWSAGRGRS